MMIGWRAWWSDIDLIAWESGARVMASVTSDMSFAQGIAAHRAKKRDRRQRIIVGTAPATGRRVLYVEDAPHRVAEPCS